MMLQAMKFEKKPVVIDAMQYTGDVCSENAIMEWTKDSSTPVGTRTVYMDGTKQTDLCIVTLEGAMVVSPGDWVIRGVQGEHYPCKPDIFAATYERADTSAMNFGQAIEALKAGKKVARTGWNGRGMFVYYVPEGAYPARTGAAVEYFGPDALVPYNPYMAIKNVNGTVSTWVPSVNDCLAEDWQLVK